MKSQQVNRRKTNPVQSPFVLTDLLKMASPQGVLLNLKNPQEVMQTFEGIVMESENILDFQHVRLLQGGIEVDLFVMSSLASTLFTEHGQQPSAAILGRKPPLPPEQKPLDLPCQNKLVDLEMIQDQIITQIFHYKGFWNDRLMAETSLQRLIVVQNACDGWCGEQKLVPESLSEHDKALLLREFLTKCLDEELCPDPNNISPEELPETSLEVRDQWIKYLILRWQYVDRQSARQVEKELKKVGCWITKGGTYRRYLKAARERLSAIIWQKEMQARKAQS